MKDEFLMTEWEKADQRVCELEQELCELEQELVECRACNIEGRSLCYSCKGTGYIKKSTILDKLNGKE